MYFTNNQNISGSSADSFAEEFKRVCQSDALSPDEFKRRKAELDFNIMKRRADNREQRMANLKERAKRIFKGEITND